MSQLFHWTIALLMVAVIVLGLTLGRYERGSAMHDDLILIHKSIGFTILVLTILRLTWLLGSPAPAPASRLHDWERRLAWLVHKSLYVLLFAMPISGMLLSQAAGKTIDIFGLFTLPQIVPVDAAVPPGQRPLLIAGAVLHTIVLKWLLFALLAGHILGALKHVLVDRDTTFLGRMWGR